VRIYDVSVGVSGELPTWPGDPAFERSLATAISRGDRANVSRIVCGVHTGTHVDAPCHFIEGGSGVEAMRLEVLMGACEVVWADPPGTRLRPGDLPEGEFERVLFKTRNSRRWEAGEKTFDKEFVAVGEELAQELVRRRIRLVGVDYLSVEPFDAPFAHPVHRTLLEAGLAVIEGLDLSGVEPGPYELCCLPVKLLGSDGAPARAVLLRR
jgi:arylformamidase